MDIRVSFFSVDSPTRHAQNPVLTSTTVRELTLQGGNVPMESEASLLTMPETKLKRKALKYKRLFIFKDETNLIIEFHCSVQKT
jgi:hypothetical protein